MEGNDSGYTTHVQRGPAEIRSCFCSGPQPGHILCPCMERHESDRDRELRQLRKEVKDLRRRTGLLTTRYR